MENSEMQSYLEQVSWVMDLAIPPECVPGVVENLLRLEAIARLVNEFPLPDDIEAAPVFHP
jgi:hypothetical protein